MTRKDAGDRRESRFPTFVEVLERRVSRRRVLTGGLAAAGLALTAPVGGRKAGAQGRAQSLIGFTAVPASTADGVIVPPGYVAEVIYAWGDPVSDGPAFKTDASNTAEEQALQAGMHHDGMHYFPLRRGGKDSAHGLLVMNHEYTDDGLLHADGMETWTADKVRKSQAAHGVSVVEVRLDRGHWQIVRPSPLARRVTASTPMRIDGPAAGHPLMQTAADSAGRLALGTFANCAHGRTPWGTYLACEENFHAYFVNRSGAIPALQRRYGITDKGAGLRWHEHDERFDAARHPNEPNRFGWVVEIDPYDPRQQPVKHTALGRFNHEGAAVTLARDGRVVVYMGDDQRFEYVYKFVSRRPWDRANGAAASVLSEGTLHVARFDADGTGEWIPLVHGQRQLDPGHGFASQADVLVNARGAGDLVSATRMDRPEWIAVHPRTGDAYCALTNNAVRGREGRPAVDAVNPRAENIFGHILRWKDDGGDAASTRLHWDVFILCGNPADADPTRRGTVKGDAFGSPDGLSFDDRGVLWIQTDVTTATIDKGPYAGMGNNQMLAADPGTGEVRRFLTGPRGAEITGAVVTPDGRSLFVNIQHPGETPSERSKPDNPTAVSGWPDGARGGRPRSATVAIRRRDGGVVGT
jgi:secreted PhoX family phosphatase